MSRPVSFFTGRTFDGLPWVLSFEGGPTATRPEGRALVSGMVPGPDGRTIRVRFLTVRGGSELRALLPGLEAAEVPGALRDCARL